MVSVTQEFSKDQVFIISPVSFLLKTNLHSYNIVGFTTDSLVVILVIKINAVEPEILTRFPSKCCLNCNQIFFSF